MSPGLVLAEPALVRGQRRRLGRSGKPASEDAANGTPCDLAHAIYIDKMPENHEKLLSDLQAIQSLSQERNVAFGKVAHLLRGYGGYRWVGLYDVDHAGGLVKNVVWSGSGAPEFPTFPITKGLTNLAIQTKRVVNVGNVTSNPHYLTAFGSTRSEIIVPILDRAGDRVVGTIDVESEQRNAFSAEIEELLKACAEVIRPLWGAESPNAG